MRCMVKKTPRVIAMTRDVHDPDDVPPDTDAANGCCGCDCTCCCGCDCCCCCCCCCCCWLWSTPMRRYPACTRKSHTRLVLFTSIFTRSRASRRRNLPPRRAYSRTSVSLITKYGLGRMRSDEQRVCSAGVRRCRDGLFARLRGAAILIDQGQRNSGGNGYQVGITYGVCGPMVPRHLFGRRSCDPPQHRRSAVRRDQETGVRWRPGVAGVAPTKSGPETYLLSPESKSSP
jgi:hypothetical protein